MKFTETVAFRTDKETKKELNEFLSSYDIKSSRFLTDAVKLAILKKKTTLEQLVNDGVHMTKAIMSCSLKVPSLQKSQGSIEEQLQGWIDHYESQLWYDQNAIEYIENGGNTKSPLFDDMEILLERCWLNEKLIDIHQVMRMDFEKNPDAFKKELEDYMVEGDVNT